MPLSLASFIREHNPSRFIAKDGGLYVVMHGPSARIHQLAPTLSRDGYVLGGVEVKVMSWPVVVKMMGLVLVFDTSAQGIAFNQAVLHVSQVGFMLDRLLAYAGEKGLLTGELQPHQLRLWFRDLQRLLFASVGAIGDALQQIGADRAAAAGLERCGGDGESKDSIGRCCARPKDNSQVAASQSRQLRTNMEEVCKAQQGPKHASQCCQSLPELATRRVCVRREHGRRCCGQHARACSLQPPLPPRTLTC